MLYKHILLIATLLLFMSCSGQTQTVNPRGSPVNDGAQGVVQPISEEPNIEPASNTEEVAKEFTPPTFVPSKDWSKRYVKLFRQAITEKYDVEASTLDENLMIVSVSQGREMDGARSGISDDASVRMYYIYRIEWALFNGGSHHNRLIFKFRADDGNVLSDHQVLANIKQEVPDIFNIEQIVEEERFSDCPARTLTAPGYSQDNNVIYVGEETAEEIDYEGGLVFICDKIVNEQKNECKKEFIDLQTGQIVFESDMLCRVS